tara:strand:+ start:45 stop:950 length:906 start_codon:yes stop_codon:yes gene_type:complete
MSNTDALRVPWERGSGTNILQNLTGRLGIKYPQKIIGGKLVDIDPRTGTKLTKERRAFYTKLRKAELLGQKHGNVQRMRMKLGTNKFDGILTDKGGVELKRNFYNTFNIGGKDQQYAFSEVPVDNFDAEDYKLAGIDLKGRGYLRMHETDALFRAQEINYAKGKELDDAKNRAQSGALPIGDDPASVRARENAAISAAHRAKVSADPWNVANLPGREIAKTNAGDGYTTNIPDLNKPSNITNKEKNEDNNKVIKEELKIAEKEPKHWIRTPLEQELGTKYKDSEAYRRDQRRKNRLKIGAG